MDANAKMIDLVAVASIITATIATLTYFDNKRHKKLNAEIMEIDKEIKELKLHQTKQEVINSTV